MKVSIIIAILESYTVVKRQILYFRSLKLPKDVEIIFMDDGSDPPLKAPRRVPRNFSIFPTGNTRPWTQACARNLGAITARGEFLLMTDIDHILTRESIEAVRHFDGDKMMFGREIAVLNQRGRITQELKTLKKYGLLRRRLRSGNLGRRRHTNSFAIRRDIYLKLRGYHPRYCNRPTTGNKGDRYFFNKYQEFAKGGDCKPFVVGPVIYTYPGLPEDPLKLFNSLPRYNKDGSLRND